MKYAVSSTFENFVTLNIDVIRDVKFKTKLI